VPRATREEGRTLASVDRALALLDALAELPSGARVGELAERTGVNQSTVSRLLGTLMARGFVDRDDATARYRLGLRLVAYADAVLAGLDVRTIARTHLERLVAETGETATLSVPGETQPFTIDFVPSPSNVASRAELGRPSVTHATVTGKLLLAFGPLPLDRLGPEPYERFTSRTLTTRREVADEVERVRSAGVAYGREERETGLTAVGAPILGREQALVAMFSIQGPANRLPVRRMSGLASALKEAANAVGAGLGGPAPQATTSVASRPAASRSA
jgi:IclR family acetate operon transcriptional repressor